MKLLLILLIFAFSLNANEMKRIEAILSDITKLRAEYEGCQTEVKTYGLQLKDENDKNKILLQELNSFKNLYKREIEYKNKILILQNRIKKQDKLLKVKEITKKDLKVKTKPITKTKEKMKETLVIKEKVIENIILVNCEEPNPFPILVMKKEFLKEEKKNKKIKKLIKTEKIEKVKEPIEPKKIVEEKLENFKASAFRLSKDAVIYDKVNGKKVDEWSVDTSFTSSVKTQNWVKITGYFVDRAWMPSSKELWIKTSAVIKR